MGEKTIQGSVYQAVEKPEVFYIVNGDAMLKLGTRVGLQPRSWWLFYARAEVSKFHRLLPLCGWWSAVPIKFSSTQRSGHLERS